MPVYTDDITPGPMSSHSGPSFTNIASASAVMSGLLTLPAIADEAVAEAAAAESSSLGVVNVAVAATPLVVYVLFNIIREKYNTKAGFGDYIYLLAASFIVVNIFLALVFKVRLW